MEKDEHFMTLTPSSICDVHSTEDENDLCLGRITLGDKFYITDLTIESSARETDQVAPNALRVTLFYTDKEDSFLLKRSSATFWKHNGPIVLPFDIANLTIMAQLDEISDVEFVSLSKTDFDRVKTHNGSEQYASSLSQGFADFKMSLVLSVCRPYEDSKKAIDPLPREVITSHNPHLDVDKLLRDCANGDTDPESFFAAALAIPNDMLMKLDTLIRCGDLFLKRFRTTSYEEDLDNSIRAYDAAGQLVSEVDPRYVEYLDNTWSAYINRFELTQKVPDVDKAIFVAKTVANKLPEGHADLPVWLNNLGFSLCSRFECTGDLEDLTDAIVAQRSAVQKTPEGHPSLYLRLNNLGNSLRSRFDCKDDLADLTEAISSLRHAIQIIPDGHVNLSALLNNLGLSLKSRFEYSDTLADISEAILSFRRIVQLTPEDDSDLPSWWNNLGISLQSRFSFTGDLADISESISSLQRSVELTPEGHIMLPRWLNNLGMSLRNRFEHTGKSKDVSEAISCLQRALRLTPEGNKDLPILLNTLGDAFSSRFDQSRSLVDISEAILLHRKSIRLSPEDSIWLPTWLNSLANSLRYRFEHDGDQSDISEAILSLRRAIEHTPKDHPNLPARLTSLGNSLVLYFEKTEDLSDINEAISSFRRVVQLLPESNANFPACLNNLGNSLLNRFNQAGNLVDVSEAISLLQRAIRLTPEGYTNLPALLTTLGVSFQCRFERTRELADISESISSLQRTIQLIPTGHADLPLCFHRLGNSFKCRFDSTGDLADIVAATIHYRQAATQESGPPSERLFAAEKWADCCCLYGLPQALDAAAVVIDLISHVAGMEKTVEMRYRTLADMSSLASTAAAMAFAHGRAGLALEWLEQGRCLVWNQLNQLRTPLDRLRAQSPDLANKLQKISRALETAGSRQTSTIFSIGEEEDHMTHKITLENEANEHIKLANDRMQVLEEIRNIQEFRDFLRPRKATDILAEIPSDGTVIVINLHSDRCDAVALIAGHDQPLHIPLESFSIEKAEELQQQLHLYLLSQRLLVQQTDRAISRKSRQELPPIFHDLLKALWDGIVKPIFHVLGYNKPTSTLRRIWWCPIGPLAFLPIHAAGIYHSSECAETILDFAISSYIPTVATLTEKLKQKAEPMSTPLLLVSQAAAPNLRQIPGVDKETNLLMNFMDEVGIKTSRLAGADATIIRVREDLSSYNSIHLACHGEQAPAPLESGFYLNDGKLKLSEIMEHQIPHADLAFLSACQTSTGDEALSEEAVHLAAGMLAAGYRTVVATMWSINDSYGPDVAREFYRDILQNDVLLGKTSLRLNGARAAYALHNATQWLRNKVGDTEMGFLIWVPYVHFGL